MGKNESFPKSRRIRKQSEFDRVYAAEYFAADRTLVIRARRNGLAVSRLGLSLSKRVGNAVIRNQWKRRIREAFRRLQNELPTGLDLVVRPRKAARGDYQAIYHSLHNLVDKLDRKIPLTETKDT